jgi:hypothetical protein
MPLAIGSEAIEVATGDKRPATISKQAIPAGTHSFDPEQPAVMVAAASRTIKKRV